MAKSQRWNRRCAIACVLARYESSCPEASSIRTIVHLSDLHFGRIDDAILKPLESAVKSLQPDVVAISGDLTQRARAREFEQARAFLDALPEPQIVVPGNHDVPLHNLYGRFVRRLDRYREFITADMEPFFEDREIAVMGVNTARSFTFKGGRINTRQVERIRGRFCSLAPGMRKILVAHHPFDVPQSWQRDSIAGRARLALQVAADCGVDVMLAGHVHRTFLGDAAEQYRIGGHSALVVHAGTATSTRGRGEANAFNVLRIDGSGILVEGYRWNAESAVFEMAARDPFKHGTEGWLRTRGSRAGATINVDEQNRPQDP